MLILKLWRVTVATALLAIMCANGNADLSQQQEQSVVEVRNQHKRCGSAFAVSTNVFVTAHHVIDGEQAVYVTYNGVAYYCTVMGVVPQQDMALLYAHGANVTHPLELGHSVFMSQDVIIYGFPGGSPFSRTIGNVIETDSLIWYKVRNRRAATCTAIVRGGYSGGPVVDRRTNDVVGILTNRNGALYSQGQGIFTMVQEFKGYLD